MRFEEQLLMDLKAEMAAQNERRRKIGRRLIAGASVAGLAAAAAVALPLLTGSEPAAYAVSKNTDGTIKVQVKEFRDADRLQRDLKKLGVTADVTYLKPAYMCESDRGRLVGGKYDTPEEWRKSVHYKVARPATKGFVIDPGQAKAGQTVVLEYAEPEGGGPGSQLRALVVEGPVKPCVQVKNPFWNDLKGSGG
ncbi:hypothetical protein [Nonomuraea candida]|uniref:hypothetical protein n=1 Tax=Nonomuraea candida TaxID=359159 RepID=UPI0005BA4E85|nr:hypothetical protein [Nonomuraea candida]